MVSFPSPLWVAAYKPFFWRPFRSPLFWCASLVLPWMRRIILHVAVFFFSSVLILFCHCPPMACPSCFPPHGVVCIPFLEGRIKTVPLSILLFFSLRHVMTKSFSFPATSLTCILRPAEFMRFAFSTIDVSNNLILQVASPFFF